MKRNIAPTTLMLIAFATFVLSVVPTMQAQCSQSGVAGQWGFSSTGTILSVVPGPFGAVGRFTLDAAGNITHGNQTANIAVTIDPETLTGTITVNPDCRATATVDVKGVVARMTTLDAVFVDNMTAFRAIFTSVTLAGPLSVSTVITVDGKKLFPED